MAVAPPAGEMTGAAVGGGGPGLLTQFARKNWRSASLRYGVPWISAQFVRSPVDVTAVGDGAAVSCPPQFARKNWRSASLRYAVPRIASQSERSSEETAGTGVSVGSGVVVRVGVGCAVADGFGGTVDVGSSPLAPLEPQAMVRAAATPKTATPLARSQGLRARPVGTDRFENASSIDQRALQPEMEAVVPEVLRLLVALCMPVN